MIEPARHAGDLGHPTCGEAVRWRVGEQKTTEPQLPEHHPIVRLDDFGIENI